ncbi:MAG TPA: iron-sulfur cluster assembly scaffold protein [Candidatus Woesebacteria bacterium]|nr:iron-sulfur cluster assembly scaffold protein [Candidatus Woesebacteria bacterium]
MISDNADNLYQQVILEEAKYPKNFGELTGLQIIKAERNISCGDKITVGMKLSADGKKIDEVKWQGSGCAISTAAMSVLSEMIKGMSIKQVLGLKSEALLAQLGLTQISSMRLKCLSLGLMTVKRALALELTKEKQ